MEKVDRTYRGRIEWVPVRKIETKELAQRPYDEAHARALAADFDPDLLGYPLVVAITDAKRSERYYAQDGQHRIGAVKIALGEDQSIECEVVRGVDLKRAAQLFLGRNRARGVKTIDKFLVGLTADEPECVAIHRIVRAAGLNIGRTGGTTTLSCASSLRKVYRLEDRGEALRETLPLIVQAWGHTPETYNGDVLLGVGAVLHHYNGELDRAALTRSLSGCTGGALGLVGKARALREALGTSMKDATAHAIIRIYNKGRTSRRLPAWGEKASE